MTIKGLFRVFRCRSCAYKVVESTGGWYINCRITWKGYFELKIYLTNGFTVCQLYVKVMTISHCDKNAALSVLLGEGGSSLPEITCLQVDSVCCVTKTMVFTFTHRIEYKSRIYTELAASFSSYTPPTPTEPPPVTRRLSPDPFSPTQTVIVVHIQRCVWAMAPDLHIH